jgi:hypothetical protein
MPLLRYFTYVGGALIALLFAASYLFPEEQTVAHQDVTRPVIRITSDRVSPPRVDLDTTVQATAAPTLPPGVMLLQAPAMQARAMQARAQLIAPPPSDTASPLKSEAKVEPRSEIKKPKVARRTASYPHYAAYPYPYSYGYQPFRWTW